MLLVEEDVEAIEALFDGLQEATMASDDLNVILNILKDVSQIVDFIKFDLKFVDDHFDLVPDPLLMLVKFLKHLASISLIFI